MRDWNAELREAFIYELCCWNFAEGLGGEAPFSDEFNVWIKANHPELGKEFAALRMKADEIYGREGDTFDEYYEVLCQMRDNYKKAATLYRNYLQIRRLAPPFISSHDGGYSYALEHLEATADKLESWASSASGFGKVLPYSEFWNWFKGTKKAYAKFIKLEEEMEIIYTDGTADGRNAFVGLLEKWDESLRWAVTEFHEKFSRA